MTDERFTDSERFIFWRNNFTGNMELVDKLNHFESVELPDELARILSEILWEHIQFVNEKHDGLFELNNLKDFIEENLHLDKEILVALINWSGKNE